MKRTLIVLIVVASVLISSAFLILAVNAYVSTVNSSKQQTQLRASASRRIDALTAQIQVLQAQLDKEHTTNAQR